MGEESLRSAHTHWLFYDGDCGLCHGAVKLTLTHDYTERFRFAPRFGETFRRLLSEEQQAVLPNSLVVLSPTGEVVTRGQAVRLVLSTFSGVWRLLRLLTVVLPLPVVGLGYDLIAKIRRRLFAAPTSVCPVVPEKWRSRFAP